MIALIDELLITTHYKQNVILIDTEMDIVYIKDFD